MFDEDMSGRTCASLEGSYCIDTSGCKGCSRPKKKSSTKKLDTEDSSWYKESVENNISASTSTSTEKEETIMSAKTENTAADNAAADNATATEPTFLQKAQACCSSKGVIGTVMLLLGAGAGAAVVYTYNKRSQKSDEMSVL